MSKIIGLLPARCGSKGIPFKNIYPINNKPMIAYGIEALHGSIVDNIYVSTDCDKVAQISKKYGAEIVERPAELSEDSSPTIDCIKHTISYLNLNDQDIIVLVQPTSPMIKSSDITNGIDTFNLGSYDTIISVSKNHNILWEEKNHYLFPKNHNIHNRIRRQDMSNMFAETGAFYIFKVYNITKYSCLYGNGNVGYIDIPKSRSFEVDDYEDLFIIESILLNSNQANTHE